MDSETVGEELVKAACVAVPKDWEVAHKPAGFDCFGYRRRALTRLKNAVCDWESEGGYVPTTNVHSTNR